MAVHVPASRGRKAEGGSTNGVISMKYTAQTFTSQVFFTLEMQEHGGRVSASGADVEQGSADMGDKAPPHYRCISTISTARCSSMVYSPSKQMIGHGSMPSHCSCRRLLRISNPPSSYDAAHTRNAWDCSYMSPPGRIRSPNRSCSRRRRRAIRIS